MKKIWLASLLFLIPVKARALQDFYGNTYVLPNVFKASATQVSDTFVTITTQAVDFGGVIVTSAGLSGSVVGIYDMNNTLQISTIDATAANPYPYGAGISISSGLRYSSIGATPAKITILWKYKDKSDVGKR